MNKRKWTIGLIIAAVFGLLNAGIGLVGDMGWKSFIAVLCTSLATNLSAYLMKHPVESIEDTDFIERQLGTVSKKDGFSVLELLVTVAVIVAVLALLLFTVGKYPIKLL